MGSTEDNELLTVPVGIIYYFFCDEELLQEIQRPSCSP